MPKQDNTTTEEKDDIVQTGIRIPTDLYKIVAKEAIDREVSASQLWVDAMREFLNKKRKIA
jgi:hypothetical protein